MRWLAIDTSGGTTVGVVEVAESGEMLERAALANPDPRGHVEALGPMVADALARAGMSSSDVDAVAVGTGPAPFTGLRVGIATAAAFARAVDCPVHGVSSLDAIAHAEHSDSDIVVVTDARRREVYWAAYAGGLGPADPGWRLHDPAVGPPSDVLDYVAEHGTRAIGHGVEVHPDLARADSDPAAALTALALVDVAATMLRAGFATPLTPQYLRRPDIHVAAARKRAT